MPGFVYFRYVEQSNIFLEQRNESLQQTTSYSQSKLVELEREKVVCSELLNQFVFEGLPKVQQTALTRLYTFQCIGKFTETKEFN